MGVLFISTGILLVASLITLASVSFHFFLSQLLWIGLGCLIIAVFFFFDWQSILNHDWVIWGMYALAVLLLVFVYIAAPVIRNTKSWIVFGLFTFQPVELAKVALILGYARYLSRKHLSIGRLGTIVVTFILFLLPAGLTLLQPDLGSVLILFSVWGGLLLVSGLPRRWVITALCLLILGSGLGWRFFLKDYQRERIIGVLFPDTHSLGVNYSSNQAKIAIGSAGLWGKGYKQGSQTQLGFLTEPEGDFIFAAFIEEWGIVGGVVIIVAFITLVFSILKIARKAFGNMAVYICMGTALMFLAQFALNTGSTIGLLPVVGVTFPFLSYGGSSLLINMSLLGIISSIARKS